MKLGSIAGWRVCEPGNGITLPGGERLLEIEVVGSGAWSMLHGAEVFPLGDLDGLTKLEVRVSGDVEFHFTSDEGVMFRTHDQENLGVVDGRYTESYTVMWERGPQQNPEFRRMMIIAELRDKERQRQMEQALADLNKLRESINGNSIPATGSPAPAAAGGTGANPAPAAPAPVSGGASAPVAGAPAGASEPAGSPAGNAGSGVSEQPAT